MPKRCITWSLQWRTSQSRSERGPTIATDGKPETENQLTDHGLETNGAHHEVVESDVAIFVSVSVEQNVEDVVIQAITGRVKSLTQLEGAEVTTAFPIVYFEHRLKQEERPCG